MFTRANATRCSPVFAVLTMLIGLEMSPDIQLDGTGPSISMQLLLTKSEFACAVTALERGESRSRQPITVTSRCLNDDLVGTNRRIDDARKLFSIFYLWHDANSASPTRKDRFVVSRRELNRRASLLVEFESVLSPAHETRGEPSSDDWI